METESLDEQESSGLVVMANSLNNSAAALPTTGSGKGRKHSFFQRSESTLCLGAPPPDPFESPMSEALPLADQPHLLQPNARREDLFGIPKQPITLPNSGLFHFICIFFQFFFFSINNETYLFTPMILIPLFEKLLYLLQNLYYLKNI